MNLVKTIISASQEMEKIWVPVVDPKCRNGYVMQEQPILFPHRLMEYIFNECKLDIPRWFVNRFWDCAISGGESYADAESRDRIPLGFYGDAAQLATKTKGQFQKMLCFFANIVVFRPKSIRYSRFLLWSCDSALLYKSRTVHAVLRWLVWSFNCLYHGKHPSSRPGNRPLSPAEAARAGTWLTHQQHLFQVVELRGDWEYHKMVWQFACSWKGGVNVGICFRCPAMAKSHDPGLLYWDMDENATWCNQIFDTAGYISKRLPSRNICHLNAWLYCYCMMGFEPLDLNSKRLTMFNFIFVPIVVFVVTTAD